MESSKIVVAETGNKRTDLSNEDVNQAITDIAQWFNTKQPKYFEANMKQGGANKADLAGLPEHLQLLLLKFNGGLHFLETFKGISISEIKEAKVGAGLVAFAKDMDGNFQCMEASGNVVTWDCEDNTQSESMSMNLGQFLEHVRNLILSNKVDYDDDLGLYAKQWITPHIIFIKF